MELKKLTLYMSANSSTSVKSEKGVEGLSVSRMIFAPRQVRTATERIASTPMWILRGMKISARSLRPAPEGAVCLTRKSRAISPRPEMISMMTTSLCDFRF